MIGETVSLGEVCEILDTLRKPITKKFRKQGQYPYYGATGIVDYVDNYIFDETLVLIGEDGAKWDKGDQTAFIVSGKYWVNNHAHVIRPLKNKLNQKFLVYYLNSIDLKPWVTGLTVPKLNQEKLKSIPIPLFTIDEQQRIVAKLDALFTEIDKIINLTKEKIIKEKDLNLSVLNSIFSTIKSKKTIGEIATVIAGQSPEGKYYNRDAKGVPFYQGKKEFGDYELKKPTFWTTKTTKEALKGDVLLSVRAPVGETNMNNNKICIGRGLAAIRTNKDNNSEFIYHFLNSIKKLIVGNTGAVFNSINKKQIEDIVIPIQSLDEQNKTINKIKLILSHIKKINLFTKQKLHNLNILKSSILNYELKNRTL